MNKKMWIGGEWAAGQQSYELFSPYSGELIAVVPAATVEEVDQAIASATHAAPIMAALPAHKRSSILERVAALIEERFEECARTIALESAKPLKAARGEIARTIQTYKFAAEEAKRIHGETIPMDAAPGGEGRLAFTIREPIGPIAAITPFNFPFNLVAHKVGPAIAAGNTVVLKPAEQTPLSALLLGEILEKAGVPAGSVNIVTGKGRVLGDKLVTDDRIKMVTFTGSVEVGTAIKNKVGLKRTTLELGSNSAVILDRDTDLEQAVPRCVEGAFAFAGQVCISIQRIYVHEKIYESFVERFKNRVSKLKLGDPLDPETDVSAMIRKADADRIQSWVAEAAEQGAQVACGGDLIGNMVTPMVILNAHPDMEISCSEAFAPIVTITAVKNMDEGISLTNQSRYGLQAGIYTKDLQTALAAARKLEVGGIMINDIPTFRVDHMPYGGVKESGMGREGLRYAVEEMTELKLVSIRL